MRGATDAIMSERLFFHRSRELVLSHRDELAYSRRLKETWPTALFAEDDYRNSLSQMPLVPSIAHARTVRVQIVIPTTGAEERLRLSADLGFVIVHPDVYVQYDRSHWEWPHDPSKKWAFDPPLLGSGRLIVSFRKDDPDGAVLAKKVLRTPGKITWRGTYGLDALRWTTEGGTERRRLGGGEGRAPPGWTMPDKPYYRDELWEDDPPAASTLPSRGFG